MRTSHVFSAILALGTVSVHAADTPESTRAADIAQVVVVPAAAASVIRQRSDVAWAGTREVSGAEPSRQERPMLDRELGTASDGGYAYYERSEQ